METDDSAWEGYAKILKGTSRIPKVENLCPSISLMPIRSKRYCQRLRSMLD